MDNEEERRLQSKLNESASTLMDRKSILDARDKLLRLRQDRQTDLAKAVAIIGTCPDMCPEQERYFRVETNQVSAFEMDYTKNPDGVPDETRMVKEYRRSGADQEEPLPHELRPINVLERTMEYLCLEIVDKYDTYSNKGEWFDFIWSRTRSIRKDITQQHLVDLKSVALVEKCARFHIFCSYYLFEEETRDFDPKINEENLNNCLQTLKDFYHDLSLRSIHCENEPEFRAYDILLNMENGETLSELKNFRPEVKKSAKVLQSIKLYQSYNSKNHVKFFKYARKADFFQSCILNRYFNSFRIKALILLSKACIAPKSEAMVPYPVQKIIELLAFDDFDELSYFCEKVGLEFDVNNIFFQRTYTIEEVKLKKRSKNLVMNKLNSSPGLAIMGMNEQNFKQKHDILPIHSSFDNNNRLILTDKNTGFQANTNLKATANLFNSNFADFGNKSRSVELADSQFPKAASASIFNVNKNEASTNFSFNVKLNMISSEPSPSLPEKPNIFKGFQPTTALNNSSVPVPFSAIKFNVPNSNMSGSKFQDENQQQLLKPKIQTPDYRTIIDRLKIEIFQSIMNEILAKHCREILKHASLMKRIILNESERIFESILQPTIKQCVQETFWQQKRIKMVLANSSAEIYQSILSKIMKKTIQEILLEIRQEQLCRNILAFSYRFYDDMFNEILRKLIAKILFSERQSRDEKIKLWRRHNLQRKYWFKWYKNYLARKRFRFYQDTFPAAPVQLNSDHHSNGSVELDPFLLNSRTFIDDNYIKINDSLKRKLAYSRFNDAEEMNRFIGHNLKKNRSKIDSRPTTTIIEATGYRSWDHQIMQIDREHYLERKYFKKWLKQVRKSKTNFIRREFPSAPMTSRSYSSVNLPDNLMANQNHWTIIDPSISNTEDSIRTNLLKKLNYDYDTIVSKIQQTLNDRRRIRQEQQMPKQQSGSSCSHSDL